MTAAGPTIANGSIVLRDGKIVAVGATVDAPADADVVDGTGQVRHARHHRHALAPRRVRRRPACDAHSDGNEMTESGHAEGVGRALGVAAGSAVPARRWPAASRRSRCCPARRNLIGGRSVVLKVVPARTVQGMKFPGAKYGLKMACGENPKRVYAAARPVDAHGQRRRLSRGSGSRPKRIAARWDKWHARQEGRSAAARPRRWRRWPRCCAATSSCTTTAIAPTRWRR